jgi:hypothetical protein
MTMDALLAERASIQAAEAYLQQFNANSDPALAQAQWDVVRAQMQANGSLSQDTVLQLGSSLGAPDTVAITVDPSPIPDIPDITPAQMLEPIPELHIMGDANEGDYYAVYGVTPYPGTEERALYDALQGSGLVNVSQGILTENASGLNLDGLNMETIILFMISPILGLLSLTGLLGNLEIGSGTTDIFSSALNLIQGGSISGTCPAGSRWSDDLQQCIPVYG